LRPPRAGPGGKALLLTILGELVLPLGGGAWTSTLVAAMATVGIAEKNARQAVARLADDGLLINERCGRRVHWELSTAGRALLTDGSARIYGSGTATQRWDGRWLVVTFSVPEDQRPQRHRLRQRLGFAGFGFPGAGVALSPHLDREAEAAAALSELGIDAGAMVFRAEAGALAGDMDLVARAWDLAGLAADYRAFVEGAAARRPGPGADTVAALVGLVHAWRHFPSVDPELPDELLPAGWPGREARRAFDDRHRAWTDAARRWMAATDT